MKQPKALPQGKCVASVCPVSPNVRLRNLALHTRSRKGAKKCKKTIGEKMLGISLEDRSTASRIREERLNRTETRILTKK